VKAPLQATDPAHWTEVLPERPQVMLEGMQIFRRQLVLSIRQDALPALEVLDFGSGKTRLIPQKDAVYDLHTTDNHELDQKAVRVRYHSPTTVPMYIDYDLETGAPTILQQQNIPGFDPSRYETARISVTARDGTTEIPVSLVFRKGTKPDGTHPLFLYGYGSYGISIVPGYSAERPSLLDRGMVYALAHVRGGGDLGKRWHDQGRLETKMNSFTDFLDVAAGLTKAGWAKPGAIVAEGGSAGGLLMGAVANLQPDAFKAIVAMVPFVDVMNTMLDETLPLTIGEYEEWGNPHEPAAFERMLAYSPYDNITAQAYPAILVRTSYNDSQVMYWEPAKYVARLRATKTDGNPLYFKTNLEPAGHGGQSGRYDRLKDLAYTDAFVLNQVGIDH
jgi:oligopeptidase B